MNFRGTPTALRCGITELKKRSSHIREKLGHEQKHLSKVTAQCQFQQRRLRRLRQQQREKRELWQSELLKFTEQRDSLLHKASLARQYLVDSDKVLAQYRRMISNLSSQNFDLKSELEKAYQKIASLTRALEVVDVNQRLIPHFSGIEAYDVLYNMPKPKIVLPCREYYLSLREALRAQTKFEKCSYEINFSSEIFKKQAQVNATQFDIQKAVSHLTDLYSMKVGFDYDLIRAQRGRIAIMRKRLAVLKAHGTTRRVTPYDQLPKTAKVNRTKKQYLQQLDALLNNSKAIVNYYQKRIVIPDLKCFIHRITTESEIEQHHVDTFGEFFRDFIAELHPKCFVAIKSFCSKAKKDRDLFKTITCFKPCCDSGYISDFTRSSSCTWKPVMSSPVQFHRRNEDIRDYHQQLSFSAVCPNGALIMVQEYFGMALQRPTILSSYG